MQEAIELLKKVLANEGDIGMHIEWNVGFREGIEHCIATLEASQQSVQADEGYECHCNAEHAHMTYIAHEEGCPARLCR